MRKRLILSFSSVIIATSLAVGPAFSIGGGGGDSRPVPSCKRGQVWDKNNGSASPSGKVRSTMTASMRPAAHWR